MPFEPQLPPAIQGNVDAFVVLDPGFNPSTIIRRDQACKVRINWHMQGLLAFGLAGNWTVKAFLESMGPGFEGQAGATQVVPLGAGTVVLPDRKNYTADIDVPAAPRLNPQIKPAERKPL